MKIEKADLFNKVVVRPVISENAMNQQSMGKYVFEVSVKSNKRQIAQAISAMYGVNVVKVNVLKYGSLSRMFRMRRGRTRGWKKAIITLEKGQSIEIFEAK